MSSRGGSATPNISPYVPPIAAPHSKIELPQASDGDAQFGGTRTVNSGYVYSNSEQIGEGTYGQVFLGTSKADTKKVALKKIRMDTEKEGFPITAIREIKILSRLHHENVVNLREIVRSDIHKDNNYKGSIYMVFDYAEYDLMGLTDTVARRFTEIQVKCILKQLLTGLAYCHANGVLHRDLKAANILIDSTGTVKLADFGLARPYNDGQDGKFTNRVITLWYRPPELLLGSVNYGFEIDMWSIGCIFAELIMGKPLFPGKDETDQQDKIFERLGSPTNITWPNWEKLPFSNIVVQNKYKTCTLRQYMKKMASSSGLPEIKADALDLLEKLLLFDPKKRITAIDSLKHQYFWNEPPPCHPRDLPCKGSSHEFTAKRKRTAATEQTAGVPQSLPPYQPGSTGGQQPQNSHNAQNPRNPNARYGPTYIAAHPSAAGGGGQSYQQQPQQQQRPSVGGYSHPTNGGSHHAGSNSGGGGGYSASGGGGGYNSSSSNQPPPYSGNAQQRGPAGSGAAAGAGGHTYSSSQQQQPQRSGQNDRSGGVPGGGGAYGAPGRSGSERPAPQPMQYPSSGQQQQQGGYGNTQSFQQPPGTFVGLSQSPSVQPSSSNSTPSGGHRMAQQQRPQAGQGSQYGPPAVPGTAAWQQQQQQQQQQQRQQTKR